ncbi:MAG TPA: hypothetical protein VLH19_03460 [Patescibacteria group bacterium]|nr:hypothetical protein [Patescibacteria group bacterium]
MNNTNNPDWFSEESLMGTEMSEAQEQEEFAVKPETTAIPKKSNSKKLLLVAALVVTVLLIITSVLIQPKKKTVSVGATPTPEVSNIPAPEGITKTVDELEKDVKASDPDANNIPFPPIDFTLHLASPSPTPGF